MPYNLEDNKSTQRLGSYASNPTNIPSVDPIGDKYDTRVALEAKQDATVFSLDDLKAFGMSMAKENILANGSNKIDMALSDSHFDLDEDFRKNYDQSQKMQDLLDNSIDPTTNYSRMGEAKSDAHRLKILQEMLEAKDDAEFIQNNLSPNTQMAGNVAGVLLDIDTLMIGPLANILAKGGKVSRIAMASAALEGTGVLAKSELMDDYDISEQGLPDLLLGTFINTAIGKTIAMKRLRDAVDNAPTNNNKVVDVAPSQIEYKPKMGYAVDELEGKDLYDKGFNIVDELDFKVQYASIAKNYGKKQADEFAVGYNDGGKVRDVNSRTIEKQSRIQSRDTEIKQLEDSLIVKTGKNKGQPKKLSKKRIEETRIKIQNLKNKNTVDGTLSMEEKLEAIRIKDLEAKYPNEGIDRAEYQEWFSKAQSRLAKAKNEVDKKIIEKEEAVVLRKMADEYNVKLTKKRKMANEDARRAELKKQRDRDIYTAKLKRNSTPVKHFYRKQDELIEQATKENNAIKAQKEIDRINAFEQLVHALGDTVGKSLARLGRRIASGSISIEQTTDAVELLKNKFPDNYKAFRSIEKYIAKHRSGDVATGGKMLEEVVSKFKGLNRLQKAGLVSFLLFAPTIASADDGESIEGGLVGTIIALAIVGSTAPILLKKMKNNTLKSAFTDFSKSVNENSKSINYMVTGKGKGLSKLLDRLHKGMSTGFNSSYKGLTTKIDKFIGDPDKNLFAKDLLRKLLFNPLDGSHSTFDSVKKQAIREFQNDFNVHYKQAYKDFTRRMGYGRVRGALNSIDLETAFNEKLRLMVEGHLPIEEGFENIVKSTREAFTKALDDAVEAGVLGAKEAKAVALSNVAKGKHYFPRIWKFTELKTILNSINKTDKALMVQGLAKGLTGANADKKAELLLDWIHDSGSTGRMANTDNMINELQEFLAKNDVDLLESDAKLIELKNLLASDAEKSGRLKSRLDIDWEKVEFPEVDVMGKRKKLETSDFVDTNVRDVIDMYGNDLYSKTHLTKLGINSVSDLRNKIASIGNDEIEKELNTAVNILLNKPIYDDLTAVAQLAEIAKGMTFIVAMPFVAFSMAVEIAKTIHNAGFSKSLKAFKHQIGRMDKDSLEFDMLANTGGLGNSSNATRYDFRGIEQGAADDVATWAVTKGVKRAQQMIAKGSGLIDISDITQKANYLHHATEFAKLVKGKDHKLMKARLESYGINSDNIKMFQDKFNFNAKGDLLKFDKASWSLDERTVFNDIMLRLNQEITPETMVGTQGLWQKTNLGKISGFLLSYPINLFENQAVKDFHYMDSRTLSNTIITFGASYLGMVAKYEALGRDYKDEDLVAYALLNTPSFALISAFRAMGDPAITSKAASVTHDIEAILLNK